MKDNFIICLLLVGFLLSCQQVDRHAAAKNTRYPAGFPKQDIALFNGGFEGRPVEDLISRFGMPLWIRNIDSLKTESEIGELRDFNFDHGDYRLWYSGQVDGSRDFIRLTCVVVNGKVTEVENLWYQE